MSKISSTDVRIAPDKIQQMVHVVRGQRVMLDFDLAQLYGVPTSALNQAVRRNADRFPEDFAYPLTRQEFTDLISQIAISRTNLWNVPWNQNSQSDFTFKRTNRIAK